MAVTAAEPAEAAFDGSWAEVALTAERISDSAALDNELTSGDETEMLRARLGSLSVPVGLIAGEGVGLEADA